MITLLMYQIDGVLHHIDNIDFVLKEFKGF